MYCFLCSLKVSHDVVVKMSGHSRHGVKLCDFMGNQDLKKKVFILINFKDILKNDWLYVAEGKETKLPEITVKIQRKNQSN